LSGLEIDRAVILSPPIFREFQRAQASGFQKHATFAPATDILVWRGLLGGKNRLKAERAWFLEEESEA